MWRQVGCGSALGQSVCGGSSTAWRPTATAAVRRGSRDWRDARSDEFFVLGSRDETAGCQLCVTSIGDDGSLTLKLRLPDWLAGGYGKYLTIAGIYFAYGHEQALAALQSNAEYARHRRQHGEKAARATNLGQAISYRFKRDGKGWRVFVHHRNVHHPGGD